MAKREGESVKKRKEGTAKDSRRSQGSIEEEKTRAEENKNKVESWEKEMECKHQQSQLESRKGKKKVVVAEEIIRPRIQHAEEILKIELFPGKEGFTIKIRGKMDHRVEGEDNSVHKEECRCVRLPAVRCEAGRSSDSHAYFTQGPLD